MKYSYKKMLKKVLDEIPLNPKEPIYGISFIAGPGCGKSTIANILGAKLGITVCTNDKIRRLYGELGFDNKKHEEDIKRIADERTHYLLANKTSHIIDVNIMFAWEQAINNFKKYNAKLFLIELTCSKEEALKRINLRKKSFGNNNNYSRATEEDYYRYLEIRKNISIPRDKIFYSINTENNLKEIERSLDVLVEKIKAKL